MPTLIALLCAGAIGSGVQVVRAVDRIEVKLEKINQHNRQQDARLDRHDRRFGRHEAWLLELERRRQTSLGPFAEERSDD